MRWDTPAFFADFSVNTTEDIFVDVFPITMTLSIPGGAIRVLSPKAVADHKYRVDGRIEYEDGTMAQIEGLLTLGITKTGSERIFVQLWCEHPLMLDQMLVLLRVLEKAGHMWPESGILKWLDEYSEDEVGKAQSSGERGPNVDTRLKLEKLREIRRENTSDGRVNIPKSRACELVGIWPDTVRNNDPDLWERWYEPEHGI